MLPQVKRALPEAKLPMQSPRVLASMVARRSRRAAFATRAPPPRGAGASCRPALARSRGARAARLGPRRLPRRRAHLDRPLRARRGRAEGARALRRPSRRPARRHDRRRQRPRQLRAAPHAQAARAAAQFGARRRVDRDLRLDDPQSRQPRRAGALEAGPRAAAPPVHRGADGRAARGRRGRARGVPRARAWRSDS